MRKIMLRAAAVGTAMMLTAAGCKQSNDTLYVLLPPPKPAPDLVPVFTGIETLQTYLEGQGETTIDKPIAVRLSDVNLSEQETSIENLFAALDAAGKYVSLDLSECKELDVWKPYGTGADRVVSLVLPDSVAEIAKGAAGGATFAFFKSLKEITANKTETVGDYAFSFCAALESASLPAATAIGDAAFNGCSALETLSLPAATAIGGYAFTECRALTSISMPAATAIGNFAFNFCTALASADLPAATTIGTSAFNNCSALASIELPSVTDIGRGALVGCASLTDIRVSPNNQSYSAKGGMLLNKAGTTLAAYPGANGAVTLPETITVIGDSAFSFCTALTSVRLPAAETIGASAFLNCAALASVDLPAAKTIGTSVFRNNTALESLTLGTTLPTLDTRTFYNAGNGEGFTVYVPTAQMKTAIDDTGSDWHTALYTNIGAGKFKGVEVITPQ